MEKIRLETDLIKKIHEQFPGRGLTMVREAYEEAGLGFGQRIRRLANIPETATFKESILAFVKFLNERLGSQGKVIDVDEKYAHMLWGAKCFIDLDEPKLCDMVAVIDGATIAGLCRKRIEIEVVRSVAKGDERCEIKYFVQD